MFSRAETEAAVTAKLEEFDRLDQAQREEDLRELMRHPRFRRWLYHLLEQRFRTFSNPYVPGDGGARATDFGCGLMSAGQDVLGEINRLCPDLWVACYSEAANAAAKRAELVEKLRKELEDMNRG